MKTQTRHLAGQSAERVLGGPALLANRVSHPFGLGGPIGLLHRVANTLGGPVCLSNRVSNALKLALILLALPLLTGCDAIVDAFDGVNTPDVYSPSDGTVVHVSDVSDRTVTFSWSAEHADYYVLRFYEDHGSSKTLWGSATVYPTYGNQVSYPMTFSSNHAGLTLRWTVQAYKFDYTDEETGHDWYDISNPTHERRIFLKP